MSFIESLRAAWKKNNSLLCLGLDPDPNRFPEYLQGRPDGLYLFCEQNVRDLADIICCVKPQIAYFAANKAEDDLEKLIAYIHKDHPDIPVILDAKRGDIGSTAEQYAVEAFERYKADAVTLSPYLGRDSIEPFLAYPDKGLFLLCRTSNPGGSDLQSLDVGGRKLYEHVADIIAKDWNTTGQCGLVVGATFPEELANVRKIVGDMPLLVPGIGAQGGDVEATVKAGRSADGTGMVVNSSRAILYADNTIHHLRYARLEALRTRELINRYRFG